MEGCNLYRVPGPPYTQWQQLPHSSPQRSWTEPWGGGGTAPLPASDRTRLALGDTTPRSPIFLPPARVDGRRRSHSPRHPLWPWPEPRSAAPPPRRLLAPWLRPLPLILLNGDSRPRTAQARSSMAAPRGPSVRTASWRRPSGGAVQPERGWGRGDTGTGLAWGRTPRSPHRHPQSAAPH